MKVVEMCQDCYGTHYTEAERQKCRQAQQQDDAKRAPFTKRYADRCNWCGGTHMTKAERAQCMLDNCG